MIIIDDIFDVVLKVSEVSCYCVTIFEKFFKIYPIFRKKKTVERLGTKHVLNEMKYNLIFY